MKDKISLKKKLKPVGSVKAVFEIKARSIKPALIPCINNSDQTEKGG
jgi:hypothetical protein